MQERVYLIAESGRPKEVLEAWRTEYRASEQKLLGFMREIGAVGFMQFGFEKPTFFRFPRDEAPEGWTKPSHNGASRPKKANIEMQRRIKDLPWSEDLDRLVREAFNLPTGLSYEGRHGVGSRFLDSVGPNSFSACWTTDADGRSDVILIVPDYAAATREVEKFTWTPQGASAEIPEGFRQATRAEVDLIFAQAKVAREQAAKQKETLAAPEP